jgi:hypothetical protein
MVKGGGKVITDGLILALDTGSPRSHTSGSTDIFDLSGNSIRYILSNWSTSSKNGVKSLLHSESVTTDDAYIRSYNTYPYTDNTVNHILSNGPFTVEFWVYGTATPTDGVQQNGSVLNRDSTGYVSTMKCQLNLGYSTYAMRGPNGAVPAYGSIRSDEWVHHAWSITANASDASGSYYQNGQFVNSRGEGTWSPETTNTYHFLMRDVDDLNNYAGHFGSFKLYNRQLSASEILENYNNTKGRYL